MKLDFSRAVEYDGDVLIFNKSKGGGVALYKLSAIMPLRDCPEPVLKAMVQGWSSVDKNCKRLDIYDQSLG
jgi:hypothetical protein